jgi:hypothetical protein
MLYNSCAGIYKFGNNTYPRRIRRRSNSGHIFRKKKKSASYGPGNTVVAFEKLVFDLHTEIIMLNVDRKMTGELNLERFWKERSCCNGRAFLAFIGNEESKRLLAGLAVYMARFELCTSRIQMA